MRRGYYPYRFRMYHHRPWFAWLLIGLAVLLVIKALPFILLLAGIAAVWFVMSRHTCCSGFDFDWHDSMSEKSKRKHKNDDRWDDDGPIIV